MATVTPEVPLNVQYSYWPVHYPGGDPTVLSNRPIPLSGVRFSVQARGVGEMRASLQLHDPDVRALDPWGMFIPRKTGVVVVRTVTTDSGVAQHRAVWHGILWAAPARPSTGRLELMFQTVESLWARRRITGPSPMGMRDTLGELLPSVSWEQVDQAQIVRDLLNPHEFSQFGVRPPHNGFSPQSDVDAFVQTDDDVGLSITGDIDLRAYVALWSYRPQSGLMLARKYRTFGNQRSWQFFTSFGYGGFLFFRWSPDGTFTNAETVSSTDPMPDGFRSLVVRVTLNVNEGGSWAARFFYSTDQAASWVQLGDTITGGSTTSIFDSTAPVDVAASFQEQPAFGRFAGTMHWFEIRDGVDGSVVASPRFMDQPAGVPQSFDDAQGNTWSYPDGGGIVAGSLFPGWINIDSPDENMGVPRDMTYRRGQGTPLLRAHQDRSKIINGYEWFTTLTVLEGSDAFNASKFRLQFIWGYPRLGRVYGEDNIPRFSYYVDGRGNIVNYSPVYDGTEVSNIVWGTGSGFDAEAVRAVSWNSIDWDNGFLVTEGNYNNPDVSRESTLQDQADSELIQGYVDERHVDNLTVRGDLVPHFGTYQIGDDCLVTTDDWTWPDNPDGSRGVTFLSRIMGWTVTPPEGEQAEHVEILIGGQEVQDG